MGVNGLTTYLRENRNSLSKTISCPEQGPVRIVVDGWSFIYEIYSTSGLPWVYGGEYEDFGRLVHDVVQSWIKIGVQLFFVFDGPYPPLKFSTLTGRVNENVLRPSLLFFRTSAVSRSTPRFLHESQMLPPLSYSVCVAVLQEMTKSNDTLEVHYADEEGDPYSVELAGRIGGYVLGNDSDFVVLNSEGYLGYIPMSEVVWTSISENQDELETEDTDDFKVVVSKKGKKKSKNDARSSIGLIPPQDANPVDLSLSLPVYSPIALANHLSIPVSLLPLLGALVGNDYNKSSSTVVNKRDFRSLFFDRRLTTSGRITHVATTLGTILSAASSNKRKPKHQLNNVMDLIDSTVSALLVRGPTSLSTGEQEEVVEKIVETTLQYAIPNYEGTQPGQEGLWPTDVCALHEPSACPVWDLMNRSVKEIPPEIYQEQGSKVTALYVDAYRDGNISPRIMDLISTGSCWPRIFLENPDLENTGRSIGQPVREWCYAVLEHGICLPYRKGVDVEDGVESDDEDELIDVVEEQSDDDDTVDEDPLTPLQNALRKLDPSEAGSLVDSSASSQMRRQREPKVITEYLRRGTRLASEEVVVPSLSILLRGVAGLEQLAECPVQLLTEETRFNILLHALISDTPSVRSLDKEFLMTVLAVRWVVSRMHSRAAQNGNVRDRLKEMWTRKEAEAFIASFRRPASSDRGETDQHEEPSIPTIEDRSIQLTAQISAALEAITFLTQALLLVHRVPSPVRHFSGRRFHKLLQGGRTEPRSELPSQVLNACLEGLGDTFAEERVQGRKVKGKKRSDGGGSSLVAIGTVIAPKPASNAGFFSLLKEMSNV